MALKVLFNSDLWVKIVNPLEIIMKNKMLKAAVAGLVLSLSHVAQAGVVPVGVQNDINFSTVTADWGWTLCHRSNYGSSVSIADMFGTCNGSYVMLAGALSSSNKIDTLAAALFSDVTAYTSVNTTRTSNGAQWYFNGYSMGFAGLGDMISQTTADTAGLNERDRLSWHTSMSAGYWNQNSALSPLHVYNGWRSGSNYSIYEGTEWERLVFTYNAPKNDIPEPSTLAIFGLTLVALGLRRFKKQ